MHLLGDSGRFLDLCLNCFVLYVQVKTVKVSNVSLGASERDLKEFFSFSGDIAYVEMQRLCRFSFQFMIYILFVQCFYSFAVKVNGLKSLT